MQELLKFITCGSVDDGKSTLIGHMLYDAKLLFTDQEKALKLESKLGNADNRIDYSLLLDGLMDEREQGITIDVAYRYFATQNRSFIVADTPGHEEYTRNMAVGASFADLAVLLVDAAKGVLMQTKRHARICSLMGIKDVVFAVNKMDLIHYDRYQFERISSEIKKLSVDFEFKSVYIIPVSATEGDNITEKSESTSWYSGETLLSYLENIEIDKSEKTGNFIMPVQRVCRPDRTFRGFQGQIESGELTEGDEVTILPSKEKANVKSIYIGDLMANKAIAGQPVTISLDKEVDVSRGCVITGNASLQISSMFTASLLWMADDQLIAGKDYYLKIGTKLIPATILKIKYKIDINSGEHISVDQIYKNEIASCDISVINKIVIEEFKKNRTLGGFILIDRVTNMTSACGVVEHSLRRNDNIIWQETDITRKIRAKQKGQKPATLWFTGLSGSGKSTLANQIEKRLVAMGRHTMLLDGDNIRLGLNKNLGFKEKDRIENIRRVAEVAKLMNDAGLIVITAFISPFARDRENARKIIGEDFIEIYVNTPIEECERRDVKGLYKKARAGELPNFTGISSPYEEPLNPQITISTSDCKLTETVDYLMKMLQEFM